MRSPHLSTIAALGMPLLARRSEPSGIVTGSINRGLGHRIIARFSGGALRIGLVLIGLIWLIPWMLLVRGDARIRLK